MRCLILSIMLFGFAGAVAQHKSLYNDQLHGYKKLFYKIVLLHPKMNSLTERQMLKHYLAGSGSPYLFSNDEFQLLKETVPDFHKAQNCNQLQQTGYCTKQAVLDGNDIFGWALGTITCVYSSATNELVSFADVYDFNKKPKGKRKLQSEIATRIFRFLSPKSAKPFIVTYGIDAFYKQPGL
jgi:hypothetical protein